MLLIYKFESKQDCKSLAHIFLITLLGPCRHAMNPQEQYRPPPWLTFANTKLAFLICCWLSLRSFAPPMAPTKGAAAHKGCSKAVIIPKHHHPASRTILLYPLLTPGQAVLLNKKDSTVQQFLVSLKAQNLFPKKSNIYPLMAL